MSFPDAGLLNTSAGGRISIRYHGSTLQIVLQICSSQLSLGHGLPPAGFLRRFPVNSSFHRNTCPHGPLPPAGIPGAVVPPDCPEEGRWGIGHTGQDCDRGRVRKCNLAQKRYFSRCQMEHSFGGVHFCWERRKNRIKTLSVPAGDVRRSAGHWASSRGDDRRLQSSRKDFESTQATQEPPSQEADAWGQREKYAPPLYFSRTQYSRTAWDLISYWLSLTFCLLLQFVPGCESPRSKSAKSGTLTAGSWASRARTYAWTSKR